MLDLPNVLLAVTAFANAGLIAFLYTRNSHGQVALSFALFVAFLAGWALAILGFRISASVETAALLLRLSYVSATLIAACFYYFSIAFPEGAGPSRRHLFALVLVTGLLSVALLVPSFLVTDIVSHEWGREALLSAPHFLAFAAVFLSLFLGGQARLWQKLQKAQGLLRTQLRSILWSVAVIGAIGIYFNLVLASPFLRNFRYVWTGPIFTALFALVITYSIFRYKLFNARAMVAELLVFALWLAMLVRTLLATSAGERLSNALLLAVSVPTGLLLIRSVAKEIAAKEELSELSRMKSELLSIVSHQLRGPVTAIRGYVSMIEEGSYGPVPDALKVPVSRIAESRQILSAGITDYLNASRIEQGRITYDFQEADLREIVERAVGAMRPAAERKGLTLSFEANEKTKYISRLDVGKMGEVVSNLLDNAIKYTPKGSIAVTLSKERVRGHLLLSIRDTGIGIDAATLPTLFQKFARAKDASATNAGGTGLGLYVAHEYVAAHDGRIWAESEGPGKGSTLTVELPSDLNRSEKVAV